MKLSKLFVCLGTLALAIATAAPKYHFVLKSPAMLAGQELPTGDYRVELNSDKAMVRGGKMAIEVPVKVEHMNIKFNDTMVRYTTDDGKTRIAELMLGGTRDKIVFAN